MSLEVASEEKNKLKFHTPAHFGNEFIKDGARHKEFVSHKSQAQ